MLKLSKLNLFSKCMFKSCFHENVNTNVDWEIFWHSVYHAYVLNVIIFYFNDIYTNYFMESLNTMI